MEWVVVGLACVALLWVVWGIARRIVRIGWFVLLFALGVCLACGLDVWFRGSVGSWPVVAGEGLVFAVAAQAIRSRVLRVVVLVALVVAARVVAPLVLGR